MNVVTAKTTRRKQQLGQSSMEYIVVTSAIVFALMQPISPPGSLQCPASSIRTDWSNHENKCSVMEMLGQVLRNRYEGYSFAISASEYPNFLVNFNNGGNGGSGSGSGTGGSGGGGSGSGSGSGSDDGSTTYTPPTGTEALGLDGKTIIGTVLAGNVYDDEGNLIGTIDSNGNVIDSDGNKIGTYPAAGGGTSNFVAVDKDGEILGKVDKDGFVVDEDGNIVGKQDGDNVLKVDALGNLILDADDKPIVIGTVGKVSGNGDIVDSGGNVIGKIVLE